MQFHEAFRDALSASSLTIEELSKKLTVTKSYLYQLHTGRLVPGIGIATKLMKLLPFPSEFNYYTYFLSMGVVVPELRLMLMNEIITHNIEAYLRGQKIIHYERSNTIDNEIKITKPNLEEI